MPGISRRGFVALSAGAAAGTVVAAAGRSAAAAKPAAGATGTIEDVKHVVVLMQENRSFDHYFGSLKGVRGFADRATISLPGGASVFDQPNGSGRQYPWQLSATSPFLGNSPEKLAQCDGSLDHGWSTQHAAWNNGLMDSWVAAKDNVRTLGYLDRADIPFHYALADAYTVCDAYHCSIISATGPNRTYLWGGMIDPGGTAGGPAYDGADESGLTWHTYAEALQDAGVSWKVYQRADDNFGDNALAYFTQFAQAGTSSPLHQRGMASVPDGAGSTADDIVAALRADTLAGTLPQVSWVVADQGFSEHPDSPPGDGAHFVNNVLQALAADPDVFDSTAVFLNYDENDGFFDHVPPPVPAGGTAEEFYDGAPIGLGFRVPMIVISPWTRGGWVDSQVYDHTSVIRFLETWTAALGTPAACGSISAWRRQVCGDLTGAFDFANPVSGLPPLPDTGAVIGWLGCSLLPNPSPTTNALPVQEAGTKPARALPYQPNAYVDRLEFDAAGRTLIYLDLANTGPAATSAAHFAVYANAHRTGGPWQYTVGAGATASDWYNIGAGYGDGAYDLTVTGPNRFLRRFTGDAGGPGATAEATSSYRVESGTGKLAIWFTMTNSGAQPVTFDIRADNYRTGGPWTYQVAAGESVTDFFNAVALSDGWYDLTVTVSSDSSWSRRFTGHLETGAASVTG
ncbi:phospholipase C, phosphocholine-specific [Streptomyces sp. SL13]|uniref:phospholipase C n=1 Tax=Streptantibioticus silvisoli TaxID=2705255 RepID=A0AA90H253_9ACTN|nr:phospholipase C, phosphocholine-specific [Streptantibioticus silvisoli]MDI5969265.1 phospholipase C, phosphocholine-specific [Streptantibioticus silvisoli]